jgi:hypothetical protein
MADVVLARGTPEYIRLRRLPSLARRRSKPLLSVGQDAAQERHNEDRGQFGIDRQQGCRALFQIGRSGSGTGWAEPHADALPASIGTAFVQTLLHKVGARRCAIAKDMIIRAGIGRRCGSSRLFAFSFAVRHIRCAV